MAIRGTEDHINWLSDLANGYLTDSQILQGFIGYYVLDTGFLLEDVQDDLVLRTSYGGNFADFVVERLRKVLGKAAEGGGK